MVLPKLGAGPSHSVKGLKDLQEPTTAIMDKVKKDKNSKALLWQAQPEPQKAWGLGQIGGPVWHPCPVLSH